MESKKISWCSADAAALARCLACLLFSAGLFYSERWLAGTLLLFVFAFLLIANAPKGGAF